MVSLTDNVPLLTAWANDSGYEHVFSEQLTPLARPGDLLVAISASGNSPNVVAAIDAAQSCGMAVVGLTGRSGGRLAHLADVVVNVPSDRIEIVEDAHLVVVHSLCVAVRERLASGEIPIPHQPNRRAGATRRSLKAQRGWHFDPEQQEPTQRYAPEKMESASPKRRHWLIWDGG